MNAINYLNSIQGVTSVEEVPSPPGRVDKQYKVSIDKDKYDISEKTVVYTQIDKKISFKNRITVGRLIGYNHIQAFISAISTIFKSQKGITDYYIKRLKGVDYHYISKKTVKFYANKQITRVQLMQKLRRAFFHEDTNTSKEMIGETYTQGLYTKVWRDFTLIDYDPASRQIQLKKERNTLQKIAKINIRRNPYNGLNNPRETNMKEFIISEELLAIPDEPIFKEMKKIQRTIFTTLGFEKNP